MVWLHKLWRAVRRKVSRGPVPLETSYVSELPPVLDIHTVYVITDDGHPWSVVMLCPCGCTETLHMSLLEGRPQWHLTTHSDGTATLAPSVWRERGCRS